MKTGVELKYLASAVILVISGNVFAEDIYGDFLDEAHRPNLEASYLPSQKKIEVKGGVIAKNISDYLSGDVIKSIKKAEGAISEDCPGKGAYELGYEFNHVTKNLASFKRFISFYDCYATGEPDVEYVNIFNHGGALMKVDFNSAKASTLKYSWKDVDEECGEVGNDGIAYALLVNASGQIEVNINKSPICDLNLALRNERNFIVFQKLGDDRGKKAH